MGSMRTAIGNTLKGAVESYLRYPAAMISATALAIFTSIRIADNTIIAAAQFSRWQMVLAVSALISLAWTAWLQIRLDKSDNDLQPTPQPAQVKSLPRMASWLSLTGLVVIIPLFFLIQPVDGRIPQLTISRVIAAGGIAVIALILIISWGQSKTDFNKRFFMIHKALFVALLYMLVVMGGSNFIAVAVENLLYNDMSSDVYQHLTTWSGFLGFAFFLGNLPDLRRTANADEVQQSQKQPRFIEVLFVFVMIPIVLVLSLVLLLWALRMLLTGEWPEFSQLAVIFSGYIVVGVWLNLMVADSEHGLARFYRRLYPILSLVFLAVEAFAIYRQIDRTGIKGGEYAAAALWIFGLLSALIFLIRPVKMNHLTAWIAMLVILISVLPITGYDDLTFNSQINRLEQVLISNQMLVDGKVFAASKDNLPSKQDMVLITETTIYLQSLDDRGRKPGWLPRGDEAYDRFESIYGFEQRWDFDDYEYQSPGKATRVVREEGTVNLEGYDLALLPYNEKEIAEFSFDTQEGSYELEWSGYRQDSAQPPKVKLTREGELLIDQDLKTYFDQIIVQTEKISGYESVLPAEQMQFEIETADVSLLFIFKTMELVWESDEAAIVYIEPYAIYFGEK